MNVASRVVTGNAHQITPSNVSAMLSASSIATM
jgi:hypothetical protein